jgi:hypothetical protein
MANAVGSSQSKLRPYGLEPDQAKPEPRSAVLLWLVGLGLVATLISLPMIALLAWGWGFMIGGWGFLVLAFKVLLSMALLASAAVVLFSRADWVASTAAWLGVMSLLVCFICWLYGFYNPAYIWSVLDTIGVAAVTAGAGIQRIKQDRGAGGDMQ